MTIIIITAILFSIRHYFYPQESENPVVESKFRLRFSFMEDRFDEYKMELDRYLEEHKDEVTTLPIE
ncbi:MAG TPA: hypothetical protein PK304_05205 [Mobilitalea sp.]|nr:hypothetical protein [Mobilitalea sp.]